MTTDKFLDLYQKLRETNRELKTAVERGEKDKVPALVKNYVKIQVKMIEETANDKRHSTPQ